MKNKIKTYLAGPINHMNIEAFAKCKDWREGLEVQLSFIDIECLNPLKHAGGDSISKELRLELKRASKEGDLEVVHQIVGGCIIPPDLKMVEEADFITIYLPERVVGFDLDKISNVSSDTEAIKLISDWTYEICGTYGEATLAKYLKKPIYVVTDRANNEIPEWLTGCATYIYNSWEEYLRFIFESFGTVPRETVYGKPCF